MPAATRKTACATTGCCSWASVATLDAPLTCAIEKQYGGATIQTYAWSGRINNVGVEDIRGVSDFNPSVTTNTGAASYYFSDELHALDFIEADTVENGWVRRVTSQSFGYACVHLTAGSRNFTLRDCDSLDPVSIITGERRYAFSLADAQNCLVQNCYTRNDRHQFVTDSLNTGPNVFVDGVSDLAYNDCGPHFRWGTGAIWDNVTVNGASADGVLAVRNRGNLGTSHGWAGANEVVWNARAADSGGGFTVESPPTARNWLIGGIGKLVTNSAAIPNPAPAGTYDSRNTNVFPNSLYFAELQDRLAVPNLQPRDYWLGVIDAFTNNLPGGEKVFLDSTWSNAVNSAAGGQPLDGFNIVTNNHWIPFSFNFTLATNESVIAATLSLSMRAFNSANTNKLYLGATNNSLTFSNLGWLPIGTGTNTTVRVLDLVSQLNTLTNGQLNVAAQGDLGIDWAMLELQVAPTTSFATASLAPVADAAVRGGTNAAINFGTATTLTVRQDASTNNQQRAYLRWDLSGVSRPVLQARVVLTPVNVPANGIEQGVAIASSNNWTEAGITWNNQPAGGERFATWLPGTNTPVSFDVTPQVMDALTADKQLSVELFSIGTNSVDYASRENAPATNQPQLVLVINKAAASVTLTNLSQTYDGTAKNVTATTVPPGLTVNVTYNGSPSAPTNAGSYTVVGTINDINYSGSATNTLLVVSTTPPQFTNTVYSAGSGFTLSGTGPAGQPYRIFATTNLVLSFINWTAISTGSFGGGVFSFIDPQATSQVQRFYRIVTP